MLRSVRDLQRYAVRATDGEAGGVHALYFDDLEWAVRYVVVDLGTWLPGRRVLLSTHVLGHPDGERLVLPVQLTQSEVEKSPTELEEGSDPHLRSSREIMGYRIQARDGEIGHVEDWIVEDEIWAIRYLIVDTGNWLPGKRVLVAPAWVETMNWADREVRIDLKRETIEGSPEFDPAEAINREYEGRLYDYYGRPKYW